MYFCLTIISSGRLHVPYVSKVDYMVDFFTKPLPAKTFFFMRDKIMNVYGLDAVRHLTSFPSEGCTVQASLGTLEQIRVRRTIAQEGGKAGAIAYLSSMKADYDHTMQHGPDNAPTKSVPATIPLEGQHGNSTLTKSTIVYLSLE